MDSVRNYLQGAGGPTIKEDDSDSLIRAIEFVLDRIERKQEEEAESNSAYDKSSSERLELSKELLEKENEYECLSNILEFHQSEVKVLETKLLARTMLNKINSRIKLYLESPPPPLVAPAIGVAEKQQHEENPPQKTRRVGFGN